MGETVRPLGRRDSQSVRLERQSDCQVGETVETVRWERQSDSQVGETLGGRDNWTVK